MAVSFTEYMVALRGSGLAGSTRSIALWVASRCSCGWPVTREMIAEDSGFSRATVSRALAELFEQGWLGLREIGDKGTATNWQSRAPYRLIVSL